MWDRVPDAEAVTGHPQIELVIRLAESAGVQHEYERRYELVRRAVDMLGADTDPLLASRATPRWPSATCGPRTRSARRRRAGAPVEYAGESPSEELARALLVSASHHISCGHLAVALGAAERAADVAGAVGCTEVMLESLGWRGNALFYLGRVTEALAQLEQAVAGSRRAGLTGDSLECIEYLARQCTEAGQVDRGPALATDGCDEGLALGFTQQAAGCGDASVQALVWLGRLDKAEQRLEAVRGLQPADAMASELLLARGDGEAAAPLVRAEAGDVGALNRPPDDMLVLREVRLPAMLGDAPPALEAAAYLAQLEACDSPLTAGAAARIGFHALALDRSMTRPLLDDLRDMAARQLDRGRTGLTDEWRGTYRGVQLALAEAYAVRAAGEPAVDQFRVTASLADPLRAFFALEPWLDLAEELLAHGGRNEGGELLVECWSSARAMGAGELERRAFHLATRTRVPLPGSAAHGGPLSRLTPREREVLDLLATSATNKTIAGSLFISEKTVSGHVSRLLGKLGVENRGAAAALARRLVG